jgi:hypothetical protein
MEGGFRTMRRFLMLLLVASTAAFLAAMPAAAEQSYSDPGGDAGPGTDITSITVRNDQAGLISIQIASANPIVGNHALAVFIDADKNPATGDEGDEAWMFGGPFVGSAFFNCSSAGCTETDPPGFGARAAAANVTEFTFNRSAIGNTSSFNFVAISISIDPPSSIGFWDITSSFTYDLSFPQCSNGRDDDNDGAVDASDLGCSSATDENEADDPVNVKLGAAKAKPAAPKAGSVATIWASTTRVETGKPLESGNVSCVASYAGGKKLRGSGSVVGGNAMCKIKLPATSRGKKVRGTMTLSYKTAKATSAFSFQVK